MRIEIGRVTLDIDVERTRAFYADYPFNDCGCAECLWFREYAPRFDPSVHEFLRSLGIADVRQAIEVYHFDEDEHRCYSNGWFHVCGEIVENGNTVTTSVDKRGMEAVRIDAEWMKIGRGFSVGVVQEDVDLMPDGFPLPAVQLEFCAEYPRKET